MVSLKSVGTRFEVQVEVIENGRGFVRGVIGEAPQDQIPSYIFLAPRLIFRVKTPSALHAGVVIRTPEGHNFIVGDNGPAENAHGTLWESYRLFQATDRVAWKRRSKTMDPVAHVEREGPEETLGLIWVAIEPTDREQFDRKLRSSFESARFIAAADVRNDDLLGDRKVTRSDPQLGLRIGAVT